jgi:hypothetical protein
MSSIQAGQRNRPLSQSEIDELAAELRALDRAAHSGEGTIGKDARAARALAIAGEMVESLAGWAIDHQVGLAVNEVTYEPLDLSPAPGVDADNPRHEEAGASYKWTNPQINRRALANLLATNPGGFPYRLALEAALCLEALDLDQTPPILECRKLAFDDPSHALALLRLRAVEHVTFYYGAGSDRAEAERKVAQSYSVRTETLSHWEARLPLLLSHRLVSERLHRAEASGVTARRLGLPLCQAEMGKRDQQLRSDANRHDLVRRQLAARAAR